MSIKLFKGDDSDFAGLREISVVLNAPFDLSGWSAEFTLQGHKQRFAVSSGEFSLVFSAKDTRHFSLGECYGTLVLYDSTRRGKTLVNSVLFEVIDTIDAVTDDELTFNVTVDSQNVEITFESSTVGAETLDNKTTTIRTDGSADDIKYPTEKAVADGFIAKGAEVYAVSGYSELKTLNLADCTIGELCDLIGTLIETLQTREIIQ
jgi:hypothetical protein